MVADYLTVAELKSLRLQAVLAEYRAVRSEMLQKFRHHLQIYSVVVAAVTVILGWVVAEGANDALLVIPIISVGFTLRYIWEQNVIIMLGDYLKHMEENIFPILLSDPEDESVRWVQWEHYFRANFPTLPFYKPAILILLVIVPLLPAIGFSAMNLLSYFTTIAISQSSQLPAIVHALALVMYVPLVVYLSIKLWKS